MFDKVKKERFKWLIAYKYFAQLVIAPVVAGLIVDGILFIGFTIIAGVAQAEQTFVKPLQIGRLKIKFWICGCFEFASFVILPNLLSVIPSIKLLIDAFSKNDSETKEIEISKLFLPYELQCVRQSKRFICDTFSRKTNLEAFIYDENKKKYRFFWNESYSSTYKDVDLEICRAKRLKISYYKRSRIIYACEILESHKFD